MNSAWSDPILTCAEARAQEARLFAGGEEPEWTAMQRAGAAVGRAVLEDFREIGGFPARGRILVLVGKGHNGGDALLAAAAMLARCPGASADVVFALGERSLRPLAARAWRDLIGGTGFPTRVQRISPGQEIPATTYDVCLDGVFGFPFRPPMDAGVATLLCVVNAHPAIRLRAAVDLPSGVGETSADEPFRADFTYATGSVKSPLLAEDHRAAAGRLRYLDLGFFGHAVAGVDDPGYKAPDRVLKSAILAPLAALRAPQSDKRTFGHLFVIGGSRRYPGTVLMNVRAALRSGVGLVTAFVPDSLTAAFAARAPEAIWVGWPETPEGSLALAGLPLLRARLDRATALAIGSGLGSESEALALVGEILKLPGGPVVLDADALQPGIVAAAPRGAAVCLPHAGEFQRLARGREGTADTLRALARETGATIVLKGPVTRIASGAGLPPAPAESGPKPRSPVYHSFFGGPVLARGGSGDLLAGLVGGLLAQAPRDPLAAACRGVVWHGLAADLLARNRGQTAVQVTQLLDELPAVLWIAGDSAAAGPDR
jgi:ADP-dependent NAD(P)H-hydrate dehydratase / NAD(P)H-hydrate epimerase